MYQHQLTLSYELNSTTNVHLHEQLWYQISHEDWYAMKQRNQTKRKDEEIKTKPCVEKDFKEEGRK